MRTYHGLSILWLVKHFHIHHFIWGRSTFYFTCLFTKYLLNVCPMLGTVQGVLHMLPPNMTSPVYFTVSLRQRYHCCFAYEKTMAISGIQRWRTPCPCSLEQRWANFVCKGANSRYFRHCGPYILVCVREEGDTRVRALSCVWLWPHGLSDSSVHGISQARMLEWVAISSSRGSFWPRDRSHISYTAGGFFPVELQLIFIGLWWCENTWYTGSYLIFTAPHVRV